MSADVQLNSRPVFGDPEWIRKAGHWRDLPGDTIVTIDHAMDAGGYCARAAVEEFADQHFIGWRRRGGVTVAQLAALREQEPEVDTVLAFMYNLQKCGFCGRVQHAPWCIETEEQR